MNPRHFVPLLAAALSCAAACVQPGVGVATRTDPTSARLDPCPALEFLDARVPVDLMAFMDVGVVEVRYRVGISQQEFENLVLTSVQPRACEWGATHLVRPTVGGKMAFPGSGGGIARSGNSGSIIVTLYRKPRPGEATPLAKSLHIDESSLKSQVSFDTSCPEAEITVLRKHETQGSGSYELRACGQDLKYSRQGSVFQKIN